MNSLPFELIDLIIQTSLPPLKLSTYSERYSILTACALVSREWKELAQEKLIQHVTIQNQKNLDLFTDRTCHSKFVRIQSLCLYYNQDRIFLGNTLHIRKLVNLCLEVKELWFIRFAFDEDGESGDNTKDKDRIEWEKLSNLTSLHFIECTFSSLKVKDPDASPFLHLEHLTLYENKFSESSSITLQSAVFPALTSLTYIRKSSIYFVLADSFSISPCLASQVQHLTYYDEDIMDQNSFGLNVLHKFTNLKSLILRNEMLFNFAFPKLDSLTSIAIAMLYKDMECYSLINKWVSSRISPPLLKFIQLPELNATQLALDSAAPSPIQQQLVSCLALKDITLSLSTTTDADVGTIEILCDLLMDLNVKMRSM